MRWIFPRLVTALADWLACLLYLRFLPPRYGGVKRAALYGGALAALALYLVATDGFNGWRVQCAVRGFCRTYAAFYGGGHPCRPLAGGVFLHAGVYSGGFCRGADMADVCIFCTLHRSIAKSACLVLFIAAGFGIIFGLMWLLEDGGSTGSIQFDIRLARPASRRSWRRPSTFCPASAIRS